MIYIFTFFCLTVMPILFILALDTNKRQERRWAIYRRLHYPNLTEQQAFDAWLSGKGQKYRKQTNGRYLKVEG